MTIEEITQRDPKFRYMLLSRLQSDCNYYLNHGGRQKECLWAGDEKLHIEYMIQLHNSFKDDEKPQWLTIDEIIEYQKKMINPAG